MTRRTLKTTVLAVAATISLATLSTTPAAAAAWRVDAEHSHVGFSVKHFFTPVHGEFEEFQVDLFYDVNDPDAASVEVTIPVASIDTGNERRDGHLQSADFFEAETYPNITFKSSSVRSEGENRLVATGTLTIKDVSREIELPITIGGVREIPENMRQMLGAERVAGFEASTKIDRGDFGVGTGNWAATVMVGGEVAIDISIQARN